MLVLSRKISESIMIDHDIEVVVLAIEGDTVKLGISAPGSIKVHRKEIYDAISKENTAAHGSSLKLAGIQDMLKNIEKMREK